eukprot:CAMPEP_0196594804 /NCGR_PEP_ID=MMETSP1081-20130531/79319_1 /TAXON_ID=36882 /ORGANISM="Pyramimonas amylifera, Strain CCMP720" /LENGTH=173 /DNA_ID=CAMNT_0041919159 /DNA_START=263 /DNA_END=781 /DNA_ORIENTATION=-
MRRGKHIHDGINETGRLSKRHIGLLYLRFQKPVKLLPHLHDERLNLEVHGELDPTVHNQAAFSVESLRRLGVFAFAGGLQVGGRRHSLAIQVSSQRSSKEHECVGAERRTVPYIHPRCLDALMEDQVLGIELVFLCVDGGRMDGHLHRLRAPLLSDPELQRIRLHLFVPLSFR